MSDLYALFVGNLGDRIAGGAAFVTPWADVQQLSAKGIEGIQEGLQALGYAVAKIDGKAGMNTRSLIGAYQKANGLKVDCWPTEALLTHVRAKAPAKGPPVKGADAARRRRAERVARGRGGRCKASDRSLAAAATCCSVVHASTEPRRRDPGRHHLNALPWQGKCRMVGASIQGRVARTATASGRSGRAAGPLASRAAGFSGR